MNTLSQPTYYVRHPDDSYSVADPQPVLGLTAEAAGQREQGQAVAEVRRNVGGMAYITPLVPPEMLTHGMLLYTTTTPAQPAREWVGLTPDEINQCWWDIDHRNAVNAVATYGINIEAKLREKNAGQPVAVPQGWKLVPVEPTPEMLGAGLRHVEGMASMPAAYRAMLSTAPQPTAQPEDIPAIFKEQAS